MSQIEELLREALAQTPTTATTVDPVGALDRRVRRARRRLAVGSGVAAIAVVVAVLVPLAALRGHGTNRLQVAHTPTPTPSTRSGSGAEVWVKAPHARGVATGDDGSGSDGVWGLVEGKSGADQVAHFDAEGVVDKHFDVPGPVDFISVGLGYVWAYGGGDGAYGDLSVVNRVDPATGKLSTLHIHGKGAPYSMVFTAQSALVALSAANQVARVSGVTGSLGVHQAVRVPGQPTDMVAAGDGTVWVRESLAKKWAQLDVADGKLAVKQTVSWAGPLFGFSHDDTVWTSDSKTRIVEITPSYLSSAVSAAYGRRIATPRQPLAVVAEADGGGIYVATGSYDGTANPESVGISYYSDDAVQAEDGRATARLVGVAAMWIAAAPDGGVLIVTQDGQLEHWNPVGG